MILTIPIYVEGNGASPPLYAVRPLFHEGPVEQAESVRRAVARLENHLRRVLEDLAADGRHEALAAWAWCPEVEDRLLDLHLEVGKSRVKLRLLVAVVRMLGRRVAWLPTFPDVWLEVAQGEALADRVEQVLGASLRRRQRGETRLDPEDLELLGVQGKAWVSMATVHLEIPKLQAPALPPKRGPALALLGGSEKMSGRDELYRVGRCLDWLHPDGLDRCIGREAEVEALMRALSDPARRPVALRGPRQAGKSCILHEAVFRRVQERRRGHPLEQTVWLLSPQRLISGMSFLGQWEERLLAILKTAAQHDAVLYFDDVLGLFTAGQSRDSRLSVADLLKPWMERRDVRVAAELTPAAWRVLQERDRGLADLLVPIVVEETAPDATLRILLSAARQAEWQHKCSFEPEVVPAVLDVTRRYVRDAAFPGKAAVFLRHLAVRHRGEAVARHHVLRAFEERSGLSLRVLDDRVRLERREVVEGLRARLVGQDEAVAAAADAVSIAKARVNDPERPLASFLFVGPTGTGKTQCARALADVLFKGDSLLRFDMNEFVTGDSVARLVGTFSRPEGLLTAAVRRNPFAVVLLDEIEKAHPDAFNLLLQVMGDARLTDAVGRTVSFHNVILILTSNLGSVEAAQALGLRDRSAQDEATWLRAVRDFFPPEFFNRLDRVVPFQRLSRDDVERIARGLLRDLLGREGIVRRRCIVRVEPEAMRRIVESGYHPQLGARALKRVLERQVTGRVAARLAALPEGLPPMVTVRVEGDGVGATVRQLEACEAGALRWPRAVPESLDAVIQRLEAEVDGIEPGRAVSDNGVDLAQLRYFAARDCLRRVHAMRDRLRRAPKSPQGLRMVRVPEPSAWLEILTADDPGGRLRAVESALAQRFVTVAGRQEAERDGLLMDLLGELAWLGVILDRRREGERAEVRVRSMTGALDGVGGMVETWRRAVDRVGLVEATRASESELIVEGWGAAVLMERECGVHLLCPPGQAPVPLELSDGPVTRLCLPNGFLLDLARGVAVMADAGEREHACLLRLGLPLPAGLEG